MAVVRKAELPHRARLELRLSGYGYEVVVITCSGREIVQGPFDIPSQSQAVAESDRVLAFQTGQSRIESPLSFAW